MAFYLKCYCYSNKKVSYCLRKCYIFKTNISSTPRRAPRGCGGQKSHLTSEVDFLGVVQGGGAHLQSFLAPPTKKIENLNACVLHVIDLRKISV